MSTAICFNLDQSKILSSGNGLMRKTNSYVAVMISSEEEVNLEEKCKFG